MFTVKYFAKTDTVNNNNNNNNDVIIIITTTTIIIIITIIMMMIRISTYDLLVGKFISLHQSI